MKATFEPYCRSVHMPDLETEILSLQHRCNEETQQSAHYLSGDFIELYRTSTMLTFIFMIASLISIFFQAATAVNPNEALSVPSIPFPRIPMALKIDLLRATTNLTFVQPANFGLRANTFTATLPGSPTMQVLFSIPTDTTTIDPSSAQSLFQTSQLNITANQNGFLQATLPYHKQPNDPTVPTLTLNLSYPTQGVSRSISWAIVAQTCQQGNAFYGFGVGRMTPKEVKFQLQNTADGTPFAEGSLALSPSGSPKGKVRRYLNWR